MKRVAVTGAASGIGLATARRLTAEGWHVIGLDRAAVAADAVAQAVVVDLTDPRSIDVAAATVLAESLDALVNAAGVPGTHPPEVVAAVNLLGLRHLTETVLPELRPNGVVVNIASTAGVGWRARLPLWLELVEQQGWDAGASWFARQGWDGPVMYDRSKEAVIVLTQQLALQRFVADGVRVCSVSPGATRTPILDDFYASMDVALLDAIRDGVGRDAEPGDIAPAISFLLADDARWINGIDLQVDGGGEAGLATGRIGS